jgi:hypothetical protein
VALTAERSVRHFALWYAFRFASGNPRQLPKNAVACRPFDFGFGDPDTNADGEPPCTRQLKGIVTVELDPRNGEMTMRPPSVLDSGLGAKDTMSVPRNVRNMLEEAERAASTGDLVSAEALLGDAAQLQQTQLGPFHPDLANTLNNLAVIAEKAGRPRDAETFYRRAVAIASRSLPPDDPMVAASRQNLEDFCHAHGLPIEKPADIAPGGSESPAPPTPTAGRPSPAVSRKASPTPTTIAIAAVAFVIATFLMARPRSRQSTTVPEAERTPARAAEPARPAPDTPAPIDRTRLPAPTIERVPAPTAIALATVQLCQSLSTSDWQCVPAGDSVAPGTIVLYTRVRSRRGGGLVHRWYRGDSLRRSAELRIGANAAEGYRTYSRQTVDPGDWRVEVRSAGGDLLHEQRFTVR